jgi:hypothetical protein
MVQAGRDTIAQPPEVLISPGADGIGMPEVQAIDPNLLAPGTVIKTGDGVTLTRLDGGEGWALELRYGEFRTLLPTVLSQESQAVLLGTTDNELRSSLLKTPGSSSRAWPSSEFLSAAMPQLILWPEEAAYPPGVEGWLTGHGAFRVPADSAVEVITDGERMWLRQYGGTTEG